MARTTIDRCLRQPVIPVVWDPLRHVDLIARASAAFLQGGSLAELPVVLDKFDHEKLARVAVFAHIDLISGLENSEAGLDYLAQFGRLAGIVTVHHHLAKPARRLGLLSVVRLFISDGRALDRGVVVVGKSQPDALEILPAVAAVKVAADFTSTKLPLVAGGLCRTVHDVREALDAGCRSVTCTRPALWELNSA
jgi:glycerol uptake operon antiterminator